VDSVGQFQSIVNSMAAESGWQEPRWYLTTVEDSGTGQAEQAADSGDLFRARPGATGLPIHPFIPPP